MAIMKAAAEVAAQSVAAERPEQWGLLTAISPAAKERKQGEQIVLYRKEHLFGRLVPDRLFKFEPSNVSGKHCRVFLQTQKTEQGEETSVLVQDSSSNGTFVRGVRLEKGGTPVVLHQGDVLSLVGPPESDAAFAYVFRLVGATAPPLPADIMPASAPVRQPAPKRKPSPPQAAAMPASEQPSDSKRLKAMEPVANNVVRLDELKRLQRSNEDLRGQLETKSQAIEANKAAMRAIEQKHQEEKAALGKEWEEKLEEARAQLKGQVAAVEASKAAQAQQQSAMGDLEQRLAAAKESRQEAEDAIKTHLTRVNELEGSVEEERKARASDRSQAEAKQKEAVARVREEAEAELARRMENISKEQEEQTKRIQTLQETDKENRAQIESLRARLEKEREALVEMQEQGRKLQAQVEEEKTGSAAIRSQLEAAKNGLQEKEDGLQEEKARRAQFEHDVSSLTATLEEKNAELALERQRRQGMQECILVRNTQLRAFHKTTMEAFPLFQTMMEQLATMRSVSALAPEDEQQDTRSGGDLELCSKQTGNPPSLEGGENDTGNSPLRRDEGGDVNMTQLEDEEDMVLCTVPVKRTPQKTPRLSLGGLSASSPAQKGSGLKALGLKAVLGAGLVSPGGVSRALHFEGGREKPSASQQGGVEMGEKGGVFAKPANKAPTQEKSVPSQADEGEKKSQEESKGGADEEENGNEEESKQAQEGENEGEGVVEKSQAGGEETPDENEGLGADDVGTLGGETLLMEDDVVGTVPATYAGETLLMDAEGGEEGRFGTAKSTPLERIAEEDLADDVEEGEIREGADFTQVNGEGGEENKGTPPPPKESEGASEKVGEEMDKEGGDEDEEQFEGDRTQLEPAPRKEVSAKNASPGKEVMENGQPPESFQMSGLPDESQKGGGDAFGRKVSFGGGDLVPNGRTSTGGRRESLLDKMDLMMDGDFTENERGVQPSPARHGSAPPLLDSQQVKQPSVQHPGLKREAADSPKGGSEGGLVRNDGFWAGLDLNRNPPASAPPGPRPSRALDDSRTAVKRLSRRKSSGFSGGAESEPDAKRFKGAADDEVVQDSESDRRSGGAFLNGLKSESVGRKRGGSNNENEPDDDDVSDDDRPAPHTGRIGIPHRDLVSSQRSVSGKAFEGAASPASVSLVRRGGNETALEGGVSPPPQNGIDTQATGNDLGGGGFLDWAARLCLTAWRVCSAARR